MPTTPFPAGRSVYPYTPFGMLGFVDVQPATAAGYPAANGDHLLSACARNTTPGAPAPSYCTSVASSAKLGVPPLPLLPRSVGSFVAALTSLLPVTPKTTA